MTKRPNDLLNQLSQTMLPALEAEMRTVLHADKPQNDNYYPMLHYHMGWADEALKPTSVKGGKQIRPLLCLISCQAANGNWKQAIPAAAAIELLHNFSLIHDDIEDASPTRRGRNTLWKIWGIEQGINSGDALFAIAHLAMNRLIEQDINPRTVVHALRRFDETCIDLTHGQYADIAFETRHTVTVDEYLAMIQGKTAVLISLCTELGAKIADSTPKTVSHFHQFGLKLGLAFQIIDDILGIWGDETIIGKSAATDIITKKKTLPVLYGLSKSNQLRHLYAATEQPDSSFVDQAITILDQLDAYEFAKQYATNYSQSALKHLEAANPNGEAGEALYDLAHLLLKRDY